MFSATKKNQIIESQAIRDILKLITHDTWLLLDLDNTVMESMMELGSDQWFAKLMEYGCQLLPDKEEAINLVILIYQSVQHHVRTKVVEPDIIKIIKALQDIGIPVLALTARDKSLIDTTLGQLDEVGIDFGRNRGSHEKRIQLENEAVYHQGIIFCNGNDKGKCLKAFFAKCLGLPAHVVMVDDKAKHVSHVQEAVESLKIRFDGVRYGYLDEKVRSFNFDESHVQLSQIKNKLPAEIQATLGRLKVPHHESKKEEKHIGFFDWKSNASRKRKSPDPVESNADNTIPPRPSSALSVFSPKRRKIEPVILVNEKKAFISN